MQTNKLRPASLFKLTLVMLLLCALTACSSHRHLRDLEKYVADLQKSLLAPPSQIKPLPLHFPEPITFQANSERSPFESTNDLPAAAGSGSSILHPLQNYPISGLKFKGVVAQDKEMIAFVLAPDAKLYQVKLGDIIGNHYGKIVKIYPDRIEVEEKVTDNAKLTTTRIVTLQLKDES